MVHIICSHMLLLLLAFQRKMRTSKKCFKNLVSLSFWNYDQFFLWYYFLRASCYAVGSIENPILSLYQIRIFFCFVILINNTCYSTVILFCFFSKYIIINVILNIFILLLLLFLVSLVKNILKTSVLRSFSSSFLLLILFLGK